MGIVASKNKNLKKSNPKLAKEWDYKKNKMGPEDVTPKSSKIAWNAVGKVNYEKTKSEKENLIFRRSLYFVKDIEKDQIITKEHIKSIRPGYGIKPKYYEKVIGLKASREISRGTPVKKEYLIDFKKNIIE